jgi:hypothetical protein
LQVSGGISWLDDIQAFYRERSAIEKEYSAKLSALAKKYYEKKAKKQSSLSVGDTPTVTPGSLERYDSCRMTLGLPDTSLQRFHDHMGCPIEHPRIARRRTRTIRWRSHHPAC